MLKDLFKEMFEGKASPEQEMKWGKEIEKEHGTVSPSTNITDDDPVMTKKIAQAHVNEIPDYYTRLRELEKQGKAALKEAGSDFNEDPRFSQIDLDTLIAARDAMKAAGMDIVPLQIEIEKREAAGLKEATHGEVPFDTFDKRLDAALEESRMTTFTSKIMVGINVPGLKRISIYTVADGTVGLFRYEDGNAYEIEIRPASLAKRKDVWGNLLKKREERIELGKSSYGDKGGPGISGHSE